MKSRARLQLWLLAVVFVSASESASAGPFGDWFPRRRVAPKVGESAPDLSLRIQGEDTEQRLSQLWQTKPVALLFGSFT